MLSCNDSISQLRKRLDSMISNSAMYLSGLSNIMDEWEFFELLSPFSQDISDLGYDVFEVNDHFSRCYDEMSQVDGCLTIVMDDGKVIPFKMEYSNANSGTNVWYFKVCLNNVWNNWYIITCHPEVGSWWCEIEKCTGVLEDYCLGDFLEQFSIEQSNAEIINKACKLALKGQLTGETLKTGFMDQYSKMSQKSKALVDSIQDGVSGSNAWTQCVQLCSILKSMGSGFIGISADDSANKITFSNDTTVDTSFLVPLTGLVQLATAALTLIVSVIATPMAGLVVSAIGNGASWVVQTINENNSDELSITDEQNRGNLCFCNSIYRHEGLISSLPSKISSEVVNNGFIKLVNGLFTIYVWMKSNTVYQCEAFINLTCDPSYVLGKLESELIMTRPWNNVVYDIADSSFNTVKVTLGGGNLGPSSASSLVERMLTDNTEPGNAGSLLDDTKFGTPNYKVSKRMCAILSILADFAIQQCRLNGDVSWYNEVFARSFDMYTYDVENNSMVEAAEYCMKWLIFVGGYHDGNEWHRFNSFSDFMTYKFHDDGYSELSNADWSGITNNVLMSIRAIFNEYLPLSFFIPNDNYVLTTSENNVNIIQSPTNTELQGSHEKYVIIYDAVNSENPYVIPPKTKFNIWFRIGITLAIVVTATVAAAVLTAKVKKAISYRATLKRASLQKKLEDFNNPESSNYHNKQLYNKIYKDNKKYNRFWGRLTGTSYDAYNDWIEYPGASSSLFSNGIMSTIEDNAAKALGINSNTNTKASDINSNTNTAIASNNSVLATLLKGSNNITLSDIYAATTGLKGNDNRDLSQLYNAIVSQSTAVIQDITGCTPYQANVTIKAILDLIK